MAEVLGSTLTGVTIGCSIFLFSRSEASAGIIANFGNFVKNPTVAHLSYYVKVVNIYSIIQVFQNQAVYLDGVIQIRERLTNRFDFL